MNKVSANKVGLVFAGLMAIVHAVWAVMVLASVAKPFMDWILGLHFLNFQYSLYPFAWGSALMLVIITAIIGYVMGYVLGWLWNLAHSASHKN